MKTIYHVYTERVGEWDGFYDEDGNILAHWCLNDAHWRKEYMNGLLWALGFSPKEGDDALEQKFVDYLKTTHNLSEEDYE